MAAYQILVRSGVEDTSELRVLLLDEGERAMGELDALNADHARMVAYDLMALMRHRDPGGAFVLDTHVGGVAA